MSLFILIFAFNLQAQIQSTDNPFIKEWKTPFQTLPFSEIKHEHFLTAYEEGIRGNNLEIETIVDNKEEPTFENTITALEKSGEEFKSFTGVPPGRLKLKDSEIVISIGSTEHWTLLLRRFPNAVKICLDDLGVEEV